MGIFVYDGLRELIQREFINRNMATTGDTVNSIYNMISTTMADYHVKTVQLVSELPVTGAAGTIYLTSKSEPNEKNRFIAHVYENGKFVQVGSSFFPEDFEHDSQLSTSSRVTVENRAIANAIDSKYNASKVINNVVYNDANSVHADDTPTSTAIQTALAPKLDWNDTTKISQSDLWSIFRPEKNRLVYPYMYIRVPDVSRNYASYSTMERLEGRDMFTGLVYKGNLTSLYFKSDGGSQYIVYFLDKISNRNIRLKLNCYSNNYDHPITAPQAFFDAVTYPSAYTIGGHWAEVMFHITFLDPVTVGMVENLSINFRVFNYNNDKMYITTKLSDTGEENTYTTIQDNVAYDYTYTDGIPFYGFKN
jgi:hypothetical protein